MSPATGPITAAPSPGTNTVTFTGASSAINGTAASQTFNNITVAKSSQTLTIGGGGLNSLALNGGFTLTSGVVAQNASLSITGTYSQAAGTFTCSAPTTYTFTVGGNFSIPSTDDSFMRYTGGGQSSGDPYYIYDVYGLQAMKQELSTVWYKLANNIDASPTSNWTSGFIPVGDSGTAFSGNFDGNSYTITNLRINTTSSKDRADTGLFGYVSGGTIQNIGLVSIDYDLDDDTTFYAGGLAGRILNSTITDSYATGTIDITSTTIGTTYVGGLIGFTDQYGDATVDDCHASVNITIDGPASGTGYAGGFIGYALAKGSGSWENVLITDSYATGNINAKDFTTVYAGGFAGQLDAVWSGQLEVYNCYATGNVTVTDGTSTGAVVGGFSGNERAYGGSINYIHDIYATGDVTVTESNASILAGGLFGVFQSTDWGGNYNYLYRAYSTGDVTVTGSGATQYIGGFIGWNRWLDSSPELKVDNCYSTGKVTSAAGIVGGFIGLNTDGTLTTDYWYKQPGGSATQAIGSGPGTVTEASAVSDFYA